MRFKKSCIVALALTALSVPVSAQFAKGLNYQVEAATVFSGGENAPFWLTANRYGLSSIEKNNGYLRAGIFRPIEKNKKFSYALGLDLATAYNFTSVFIVQQAYVDLKYRWIELSVGSKERPTELKNQKLSSGGMTVSNNARPIPQIRISVPEYVNIGKKHIFALKGHFSYGLFTDNKWQKDFAAPGSKRTENVLYHSKSLFGRIGNENKFPLVFEGGIQMDAQFGGRAYGIGYEPYLDMPNRLKDFLKIIIPAGSSDVTDGEYPNAYGNHLGSWMVSFSYKFNSWKIRAYHEHFFEDHSMIIDEFAWKDYIDEFGHGNFWSYFPPIIPSQYYWKDGLTGIEATLPKNPFVESIVYEYLATREQSGPVYHDHTTEIPDQIGGRDNYYNHGIFTGWQHWGQAVGNPLLTSPIYNKDGQITFKGNRVKSHHIGISGKPTNEISYRMLLSHTRNWGTYNEPYPDIKKNISLLLEAHYTPCQLKGWQFSGSFAFDKGELMGNNAGGMITVRKTGLLTK